MATDQTPLVPEGNGYVSRRVFLGGLAASVTLGTSTLANQVLANEVNGVEVATLDNSASDDAQGGGIDNPLESLTTDEINQRIQDIDDEMTVLDAKSELTDADFDRLDELDAEKDILQARLLELENQQQVENEAVIEDERAETAAEEQETAENEATIAEESEVTATQERILSDFDEINTEARE